MGYDHNKNIINIIYMGNNQSNNIRVGFSSVIPLVFAIIIFLRLISSTELSAQLTIDSCYSAAMRNYPLVKNYDLIERSLNLNLENASRSYLPQLSLSGRASWQSDVTQLPQSFIDLLSGMGVSGVSFPEQDQYRLVMELSQTIWDGGISSSVKENSVAAANVDRQSLEVNLYSLKERVTQLFFGILLLDEQLKLNELFLDELLRNYDRVKSYADNGLANNTDLNNIRVEQLSREQSSTEMVSMRKAYIAMLSLFIGKPIDENVSLVKPEIAKSYNGEINRPELKLFSAQEERLEAQYGSLNTKVMPKIALFAQGAYANPGLNMFSGGFTPYFIGGIQFSWNIGGLYTLANEKRLVGIGKNNVEIQRETFLFNTEIAVTQKNSEMERYSELLLKDDEIISLRHEIKTASDVKLENGVISVNDYLRDLIAEDMAKQSRMLHEIQMLLTMYQLKVETGN
jgi:outer membrane protein TolC